MDEHEIYLTFDTPIEYKDLEIHPVKIKNYYYFYSFIGCFFLEKNSVADVSVIQMTYLDYMYKKAISEKKPYALMFAGLLGLCLEKEPKDIVTKYNKDGKPIFIIDGIDYDSTDFEKIKEIICKQNIVVLPDESIQKEIRDKIEEAKRMKEQLDGKSGKMAGIEDLLVSIAISTRFSFDEIYELTIRKFNKIIERLDAKLHYQIYLSASMSGLVEFKDKSFIKHWLTSLEKDDVDGEYKIGLDAIKAKVSFEDKK